MSFPAMDDLAVDIDLGFVSWKVYMWLQRNWLNHTEPRETKYLLLQQAVHLRPASIKVGLDWLVEHGYLVEYERSDRGTRRFTLAWSVQKPTKAVKPPVKSPVSLGLNAPASLPKA